MYQIGVDIGGTNIAMGLVNDELDIVQRVSVPFKAKDGGEGTARKIYRGALSMLERQGAAPEALQSIGVVVPGSIDPEASVVINAYNLNFHNEPLKAKIQHYFNDIPVVLANDADGAALAELHKGAFLGCKTAALFTLGTGVGGGLIIGGRMFRGGLGNGCEMGHAILVSGGEPCTCGNRGCVEAYCSATALIRDAVRAMKKRPGSLLLERTGGDESRMDAKLAIDCARDGDAAAMEVFESYIDHLGSTVASTMNLLDCERVAIGGGVSAAGEFLFEPLRKNVHAKCFYEHHGEVVPAAMGNNAGIIGAAMLKKNEN